MQFSTPFKIFLAVFGAILLVLQVFNYLYVRNLDKEYSAVITNKVDAIYSLHVIGHESSDIQRSLRSLSEAKTRDTGKWLSEIRQSTATINQRFRLLEGLAANDSEKTAVLHLEGLFKGYKIKADSFVSVVLSNQKNDASLENDLVNVKEIYLAYMNQDDMNSSFFRDQALKSSDIITRHMNRTSNLLLLVGTLPYLILACGLVLALIVIVWLGASVKWFKRAE